MSKPKHHVRDSVCASRAPYREGRKAKAVKVYTVQQESKYLLVQGIPAVGATQQLVSLFASHGEVAEHRMLDDYPSEQFTDVCLIKFQKIHAARKAKRQLDDWSFYGGVLHVCYAPEYETVQDTREKLHDRRKAVAAKVRQYSQDGTYESNPVASEIHSNSTTSNEGSHSMAASVSETVSMPYSGPFSQAATNYNVRSNEAVDNRLNSSNNYNVEQNQTAYFDQSASTNYSHMTGNQNTNWSVGHHPSTSNSSDKAIEDRLVGDQSASSNYSHMTGNQNTNWSAGYRLSARNSSDKTIKDRPVGSLEEESIQLSLPPPPKKTKFSKVLEPKQWHDKLGKVPSTHATFPPGFDARTDQPSGASLTEYLSRKGPNALNKETSNEPAAKTVQQKINENLKTPSVVIKQMPNKLTAPKFIPRQTQAKFKQKSSTAVATTKAPGSSEVDKDTLNADLKKNAFTLGKPQGAVDLEEVTRARPGLEEVSVQKSVKQIREQLSQVSKRSRDGTPVKER